MKAVAAMIKETEEGKKVERAGNAKYWAVYIRLSEEEAAGQLEALQPGFLTVM